MKKRLLTTCLLTLCCTALLMFVPPLPALFGQERGRFSTVEGPHGETFRDHLLLSELITLSTSGVTSPGVNNLLLVPANGVAVLDGVVCRVTTTITGSGVTGWQVGDGTTADRFCSAGAALTAGTTAVCTNFLQPSYATTVAKGSIQTTTAQVVITAVGGTPTAGAVRCSAFRHTLLPPAS